MMRTLKQIAAELAASTRRTRNALPLVAIASLALAGAPVKAEDDPNQPADGMAIEQPLDAEQEATGDAGGGEPIDPALAEGQETDQPLEGDAAASEPPPDEAPADPVVDAGSETPSDETLNAGGETPPEDPVADAPVDDGDMTVAPSEEATTEAPAEQPAADGEAEMLGNSDATSGEDPAILIDPGKPELAEEPAPVEDPAATAEGEQLPADDGQAATSGEGELLAPSEDQAVTGDELLPAEDQAVSGDELLPPADGEPASTDELAVDGENDGVEVEELTADTAAGMKQVEQVPAGMVKVLVQNTSSAPIDLFLDAQDGSDPEWILTLSPGLQIIQPSNPGQTWRIAQNDDWIGGFVPGNDPIQLIRFDGGRL
ncbi:MAG: hypothetical protein AB7S80_16385 [Rhizobiaceae bacterium]